MRWPRARWILLAVVLFLAGGVAAYLAMRPGALLDPTAANPIAEAKAALEGPASSIEARISVRGPKGFAELPARFDLKGVMLGDSNGSLSVDLSEIPNGGGALGQLNRFEVRFLQSDIYMDVLPGDRTWLHVPSADLPAALRADIGLLKQVVLASPLLVVSFLPEDAKVEEERPNSYSTLASVEDLEADAGGLASLVLNELRAFGVDTITIQVQTNDDGSPASISFEMSYPVTESATDEFVVTTDVTIVEIGAGAGISVPDAATVKTFEELS